MVTTDKHLCAIIDDEIVDVTQLDSASSPKQDTQRSRTYLCFAPAEQPYNHGSDRLRPLRTMPFDVETWIGDYDQLGNRVWPHPSYNELLARYLTRDLRFPLPGTIAKHDRLQNLRLRCCGESCSPTSQSPFVEYEKPSRLEKLMFEGGRAVVIYSFYVRLSKVTGLQRLFAIVHRQENGEYHFWRANGAYHESYGLGKGNVSVFKSPRSACSTNIGTLASPKKGHSARELSISRQRGIEDFDDPEDVPLELLRRARSLARGGGSEEQVMDDQDEGSSTSSPKKRTLAGSAGPMRKKRTPAKGLSKAPTASRAGSKKPVPKLSSSTPSRQLSQTVSMTQQPIHPLLHIKEVCMLAYHLFGEGLELLYRTNAFTVESAEGSLIDPTNEISFKITEKHALYVLFSRQSSFKVILSQSATHDINETQNDLTGGIILLEFGGKSARDDFMARIREMVGTSAGGISCTDDFVIERMYEKLMQQLNSHRSALVELHADNEHMVIQTAEEPKSALVESPRDLEDVETTFLPTGVIKSSPRYRSTEAPSSAADASTISTCPPSASAAPSVKSTDTSPAKPVIFGDQDAMKKQLSTLLHDTYIKYPSAQEDDKVETMALLLKAALLVGDKERIRELKMDLKVHLIAHHG